MLYIYILRVIPVDWVDEIPNPVVDVAWDAAGVTVGGAVVDDVKLNGDAVAVGAGLVDTNWKLGPAGADGCVGWIPADDCVPVTTGDARRKNISVIYFKSRLSIC